MGSELPKPVYRFDHFVLDLVRGALLADGAECDLRPKAFALLRHLVENAGHLVDRDGTMQAVWPGIFVSDDSIAQCVKEVRRALGDDEQRLLRTLPRRGSCSRPMCRAWRPSPPACWPPPRLPFPRTRRPAH